LVVEPKSADAQLPTGEPLTVTESPEETPGMKAKDFASNTTPTGPSSLSLSPPGMLAPRGRSATSPIMPTSPTAEVAPTGHPDPSTASPTRRRVNQHEFRGRADSIASVVTFNAGGADSIFRLLPREARPAIRRMMFIEPSARCTISDLLCGTGKKAGLLCMCGGTECGGHLNTPPGEHKDHHVDEKEEGEEEDMDDGDSWLKSIVPCSNIPQGCAATHVHTRIAVEEKHKKRFGF